MKIFVTVLVSATMVLCNQAFALTAAQQRAADLAAQQSAAAKLRAIEAQKAAELRAAQQRAQKVSPYLAASITPPHLRTTQQQNLMQQLGQCNQIQGQIDHCLKKEQDRNAALAKAQAAQQQYVADQCARNPQCAAEKRMALAAKEALARQGRR